jgi:hypothetical protein
MYSTNFVLLKVKKGAIQFKIGAKEGTNILKQKYQYFFWCGDYRIPVETRSMQVSVKSNDCTSSILLPTVITYIMLATIL